MGLKHLLPLLLFAAGCHFPERNAHKVKVEDVAIIPQPDSIVFIEGFFKLGWGTI
ncbi:MAG: hypothetical protein ACI9EQ_001558, partial [Bacteroidia bacterium]